MNQYITEKLGSDELVYSISVADVQYLAKERIGRELDFDEMYAVKKAVEWGYIDWDFIVKVAIDDMIKRNNM